MAENKQRRLSPPKRPRLPGYDYSQPGSYYITLCAHEKAHLFGKVSNGEMVLGPVGEIVREEWLRSPQIRPEIELGDFVIMPNHMHAIVHILPTPENDELTRFIADRDGKSDEAISHYRRNYRRNKRHNYRRNNRHNCVHGRGGSHTRWDRSSRVLKHILRSGLMNCAEPPVHGCGSLTISRASYAPIVFDCSPRTTS